MRFHRFKAQESKFLHTYFSDLFFEISFFFLSLLLELKSVEFISRSGEFISSTSPIDSRTLMIPSLEISLWLDQLVSARNPSIWGRTRRSTDALLLKFFSIGFLFGDRDFDARFWFFWRICGNLREFERNIGFVRKDFSLEFWGFLWVYRVCDLESLRVRYSSISLSFLRWSSEGFVFRYLYVFSLRFFFFFVWSLLMELL